MNTTLMKILLIPIVCFGVYIAFKYIRPMIPTPGYTVYKSIGLTFDYPFVDLEKKEVTGTVSFKNKICMTVIVNLQSDTVMVEGSVEDVLKEQNDSDYVEEIKARAKFFVENKISNPKEYYEHLIEADSSLQ